MHYCGCDIQLHSVVAVSDDDEEPVISDSPSWASLYRPMPPTIAPNEALTEVAPSTPALEEGETHSIPETPRLEPEKGALPPEDEAVGVATRIEGREVMTQTPPLLSRLIQGYLDHTGIEACPYHQMDHGVRDPHSRPVVSSQDCWQPALTCLHVRLFGPTPAQSEYGPVPFSCSLEPRPYETALGIWRRESSDILFCRAFSPVLRTYVL